MEDADYMKGLDIRSKNSHSKMYDWRSVEITVTVLTAVKSMHLKQGGMLYQFHDIHYIENVK